MNLIIAGNDHLNTLLPLVSAYHEFEGLALSDPHRRQALGSLLDPALDLGRIWLIEEGGTPIGYIALCFGYSIEFGGRDAFIDEFFIVESMRGQGVGSLAMQAIRREASRLNIKALHLEVARENVRARSIYLRHGFQLRHQYHLMSCQIT